MFISATHIHGTTYYILGLGHPGVKPRAPGEAAHSPQGTDTYTQELPVDTANTTAVGCEDPVDEVLNFTWL